MSLEEYVQTDTVQLKAAANIYSLGTCELDGSICALIGTAEDIILCRQSHEAIGDTISTFQVWSVKLEASKQSILACTCFDDQRTKFPVIAALIQRELDLPRVDYELQIFRVRIGASSQSSSPLFDKAETLPLHQPPLLLTRTWLLDPKNGQERADLIVSDGIGAGLRVFRQDARTGVFAELKGDAHPLPEFRRGDSSILSFDAGRDPDGGNLWVTAGCEDGTVRVCVYSEAVADTSSEPQPARESSESSIPSQTIPSDIPVPSDSDQTHPPTGPLSPVTLSHSSSSSSSSSLSPSASSCSMDSSSSSSSSSSISSPPESPHHRASIEGKAAAAAAETERGRRRPAGEAEEEEEVRDSKRCGGVPRAWVCEACWEYGCDGPISSVKLYSDAVETTEPAVRSLSDRARNHLNTLFGINGRNPGECGDWHLLITSPVGYAAVFRYLTLDGLSQPIPLPNSDRFDAALTSHVVDIDMDGINELLIGTYGQRLLAYKWRQTELPPLPLSLSSLDAASASASASLSSPATAADGTPLTAATAITAATAATPNSTDEGEWNEYILESSKSFAHPIYGIATGEWSGDGLDALLIATTFSLEIGQLDAERAGRRLRAQLDVVRDALRWEEQTLRSSLYASS